MAGKRDNRIMPVKGSKGPLLLALLFFSAFMIASVYLSVLQVRYGKDIQELKKEVDVLASTKREMEGKVVGETSLSKILHRAQGMGMVYPRYTPETLVVMLPEVDGDGVDARLKEKNQKRLLENGEAPLAMLEDSQRKRE